MEIKNSKDDAIKGGKWSKPSASFYDRLLAEDNYKSLINEAFLVVRNVDKDTSFSASGCKYPHHSIKNGELVVNEAGVRAAYSRAKQMGVYRGSLKEHLDCHLHELGIIKEEKHIEENFNDIFQYLEIPNVTNEGTQIVEPKDDSIEESLDWIDQFVYSDAFRESVDVFEEKSHGPLKYCYRIGFDADTGKEVAIQFILDSSKVNKVGTNYDPDLQKDAVAAVKKTIKKYGHIDFTSEDLMVDKIIYRDGGTVQSVKFIPIMNEYVMLVIRSNLHPKKNAGMKIDDYIQTDNFRNTFVTSKSMYPIRKDIELYTVGKLGGGNRYKSTKLIWSHELLFSYKYTPAIRGFNLPGRNTKGTPITQDTEDEYKKTLMNARFKAGCTAEEFCEELESMVTVDKSHEIDILGTFTANYMGESVNVAPPYFYSMERVYLDPIFEPRYDYSAPIKLVKEGGEVSLDDDVLANTDAATINFFHERHIPISEAVKHYIDLGYRVFTESKHAYVNYLIRREFNVDGNADADIYPLFKVECANGDVVYSTTENLQTIPSLRNLPRFGDISKISAAFIPRKKMNEISRIVPTIDEWNTVMEDTSVWANGTDNGATLIERTYEMLQDDLIMDDWLFTEADDEPPTMDEEPEDSTEEPNEDVEGPEVEQPKEESLPKQVDKAEGSKNGVRRKKLYIAFIEWCKAYNNKNVFGSVFDKDAFKVTYPFIPDEMRYFYRLANPLMCVLSGDLTFFQLADIRKINAKNPKMNELLIFAGTPDNNLRVFDCKDKRVYKAHEENGQIVKENMLANSFDTYLQTMIKQGDILNAPLEEE